MTKHQSENYVWRTRYGIANPELADVPQWKAIIEQREGHSSAKDLCPYKLPDSQLGKEYSLSSYRDDLPGPIWSWFRYGRTSTLLPDGRVIQIGGQFEDFYDPDFCIYNDVVVQHPDGRCDIYLYPKDVFPPTDSHTATLIGDEILLIGSTGYRDLRRVGQTQVMKLDTRSFQISEVIVSGQGPGWISEHLAEPLGDGRILVIGGYVQTADKYEPNHLIFELDTNSLSWVARKHGDPDIFPISQQEYGQLRNPRTGTSNPERVENPFWLEMAQRQWPPSRARLNFGDTVGRGPMPTMEEFTNPKSKQRFGKFYPSEFDEAERTDKRYKMLYPDHDKTWTAIRERPLELTLADGRSLRIGGKVSEYGDEYADAWVYNDIIVTDQAGKIEILAYPLRVFPRMIQLVGVVKEPYVFIFGLLFRVRLEEQRTPVVLRLDTTSYEIKLVRSKKAPYDIMIIEGGETVEGDRVIFGLGHRAKNDPNQRIAFDLNELEWSEPLPGRAP